jgi:hypothetical protein
VDEELNRLVLEESELRDADAAKKAANNPDNKSPEEPGRLALRPIYTNNEILSRDMKRHEATRSNTNLKNFYRCR